MSTTTRVIVKTIVTVSLPVFLLVAFIIELFGGFAKAFYYAWLEVRIEWSAYRNLMRRKDY